MGFVSGYQYSELVVADYLRSACVSSPTLASVRSFRSVGVVLKDEAMQLDRRASQEALGQDVHTCLLLPTW